MIKVLQPRERTTAELISLAYAVAAMAHEGQINKDGSPYVSHPIRLATRWANEHPDKPVGQIVALLHDVLEDTAVTETDLLDLGFDQSIVDEVNALTRHGVCPTGHVVNLSTDASGVAVEADLEQSYFLAQDQSSHWYVVPKTNEAEFNLWVNMDPDNPQSWEAPDFATRIGGSPGLVTFTGSFEIA